MIHILFFFHRSCLVLLAVKGIQGWLFPLLMLIYFILLQYWLIPMGDNHEISNEFRVTSPLTVNEDMLEKVLGVMCWDMWHQPISLGILQMTPTNISGVILCDGLVAAIWTAYVFQWYRPWRMWTQLLDLHWLTRYIFALPFLYFCLWSFILYS